MGIQPGKPSSRGGRTEHLKTPQEFLVFADLRDQGIDVNRTLDDVPDGAIFV
jgi:hypothetical protein